MSSTKQGKTYFEGWHDGYKRAIDEMKRELLTLERDTKAPVSVEIYEILEFMTTKLERQ